MKKTSKPDNSLKPDFNDDNAIWLTNGLTLRKMIGIFGMGLPLLLVGFLYLDNGHPSPLPSISHYYFTRVTSIFIVIISVMAVFLIIYKGKEPVDFYVSSISGLFALLLILFPTGNISDICGDVDTRYSVTILQQNNIRETFHLISAGIFLLGLAYMSFFLFTKSNKETHERGTKKIIRNRIYRTCAVIMVAAILVIVAGAAGLIPEDFYYDHHLTFWMEVVAVESFGFSWLIKGETFFKD